MILGGLLRILFEFIRGILKTILYLLSYFGLIIPLLYLLATRLVNFFADNLLFSSPLYLALYAIGWIAVIIIAVALFVRNVTAKPRAIGELSKREKLVILREKELDEREKTLASREASAFRKMNHPQESKDIGQQAFGQYADQKEGDTSFGSSFADTNSYQNSFGNQFDQKKTQNNQQFSFTPFDNASKTGRHLSSGSSIKDFNIYRVKQNPNYVIYDYGDRVDVFFDSNDGLKYIRTDRRD